MLFHNVGGYACTVPEPFPAAPAMMYDLASLTKVVCTVPLVLLARERAALSLEDPVARWLPKYPERRTTVWHLLTHTSGLPEHRPFFESHSGREAIEAAVYEEAALSVPAGEVRYSDLGFMVAGWVLEACLDKPLDELFAAEVAGPFGMKRARFRPEQARLTAATELNGDQRLTPTLVWGEVHDGNAWALGGIAGHAGLFATVRDLLPFARSLLDPSAGALLSPESVELMSRLQAESGADARGLGWRLRPPNTWGQWPESTLWHTGFTGTSLLVDRERGVAVVLLTNAIHPHRRPADQQGLRADVHSLVAEALP